MSTTNNSNKSSVQKGVRQSDVAQLVEAILKDDTMTIPMIPEPVARVIYQSTVKLTFNIFYKAIGNLDGAGLLTTSSGSQGRELHLERSFVDNGASFGAQRNWQSFQSTIDVNPLEQMASQLLKNKAVNVTVIPDAIEEQVYVNCLKAIFWVLNIITSNVKITFCGHTISMGLAPVSSFFKTRGGNNSHSGSAIIRQINAFMVNPNTIKEFSEQAKALLKMDGNSPGTDGGKRKSGVKNGIAFLKSSFNKVQEEMVRSLNTSLYGIILAIVDDLLSSTKIEILNDQISLKVAQATTNSNSVSYPPPPPPPPAQHSSTRADTSSSGAPQLSHLSGTEMDDVSLAVEATMADLNFAQERAIFLRRFQQWSPEERALLLRELSG